MQRFRSDVSKDLFRVPISITKEMESWLQEFSNTMKATGGYKLPKSYVIRSLLGAIMKLKIDAHGVRTEEELAKRLLSAIKKYK